jgi:cytochrome o ubiquinol oxidase subunit 2
MKKYRKVLGGALIVLLAVLALAGWYLHHQLIPVLQPAGPIAEKERNLMIFCVLVSAVVVIPVFTLLGVFAWKYREGNPKAAYSPDLGGSAAAETVWWLIPTVIIAVISVVTWRSSYALDPFKPLASNKPALHIQVVALDWKWLFIYPGQNVASVNEAAVPVNTPVDFELTSDAVMSSFWDPQLGGQMYAMPGMSTQLNLEASKLGSFHGLAANISGKGFAGMTFTIKSMQPRSFNSWVAVARHTDRNLTNGQYALLARPSEDNPVSYYASVQPELYDTIMLKYMMPTTAGVSGSSMGTSL